MTASVREAPQFTVEALTWTWAGRWPWCEDLRDRRRRITERPKVTVTALLVKACAWALSQFPAANSMFEADRSWSLVEWDEVNVGVATAIDQGLLVPVVHGADRLGMKEIAGPPDRSDGRARGRIG